MAALRLGRKRRVQLRNHQGREHTISEKSLAGRKALVTGGARGIGAAIAEALASAGASVMIGDILVDLGRQTAGRLAKTGVKTGFVELNVTDDAQWEKAVAATIATLGGYDILINNAPRLPRSSSI